MSLIDPANWPDAVLTPKGKIPAGTDIKHVKLQRAIAFAIFGVIFGISQIWLALITANIQDPYLDEVFHVPQAQKYCTGDFSWDPMITTPPGLYIFSVILLKLRMAACTAENLRFTNTIALLVLLYTAFKCLNLIHLTTAHGQASQTTWYNIHSAVNICLFPPLFFYSALYYTDVPSTCAVLIAYHSFLDRGKGNSVARIVDIIVVGTIAMLMRQTNVIWVGIFMAGMEWFRSCQTMDYKPFSRFDKDTGVLKWAQTSCIFFARGYIHDLPLANATIMDMVVCLISAALSAVGRFPRLLQRTWPYIALVVSFIAFVVWNGSVVLGDKSHHVATIHLPQMLYIWPFMTLFSLPLMYPYILAHFKNALAGHRPSITFTAWTIAGTIAAYMAVHFNTIIHAFTLSDNRHYVFYVFRYIIRIIPIRYLVVPIYIASGILVFQTLAGFPAPPSPTKPAARPKWTWIKKTTPASKNPKASFYIMWILATALCLISAPLVEPRYFIIPWVMWRLNVAPLPKEKYRLWLETAWYLLINFITGYILLYRGFEWPSEPGKVQRFMY